MNINIKLANQKIGKLGIQLLAYAQLRKKRTVVNGEIAQALGLNAKQETDLLGDLIDVTAKYGNKASIKRVGLLEAFAEKFRAALTRRTPAIRDFYDINYAVDSNLFGKNNHYLLTLIKEKLKVPGNASVNITPQAKRQLEKQLQTELKPVLRSIDYDGFDLDAAFKKVESVVEKLNI